MLAGLLRDLRSGILLLTIIAILTGIIYPALITAIAQNIFPWRANGSLLQINDKTVGSALIGQAFTDPRYFWGRPSATLPFAYNAESSGGSNLGPMNPDYLAELKSRKNFLENSDTQNNSPVPLDMITASASGLDPEISPQAAFYQTYRIAKARKIPEDLIENLLRKYILKPSFGVLGEIRVNVLQLNMALDEMDKRIPKYKAP